ncbi:2-oxo acid dehydrogenase subunit E2 [Paracoccus siganidrum]|uniref:Dihydrolipoamide acetyltransferase component of pyruvate dehydrogenase complex n=1 Tax=Paracoccus siganidrum TaxID=1276757 RepID=A0A419AAU5_9RHOB|nr:2-oxo acid dehydrogenase subunit E2 [Paracoccus siganidrum]RJL20244.1 2-oxo acid dehydrogenase subunit E2 [Paracoccus siganidrum]RMC30744.1 2-oxo acid dehydrogenase subunit E2 [Paracoccus siganidrum]
MARIHPVTLPKWGLEMSEGQISRWIAAEGDSVEPGTELVDIETDKIVNTLDTDKGGILRRILVPEGESAPVGALIAVLAEADASEAELAEFIAAYVPVDASFEPKDEDEAESTVSEPSPTTDASSGPKASPLARRIAEQDGIDLAGIHGSGHSGKIKKADLPSRPAALTPEEAAKRNAGSHASPVAVNFANALGFDLTGLKPSGYRGRISLADVQAAAQAAGLWSPPAPATPAAPAPAPAAAAAQEVEQPFTGMRKSIANALRHSKQTVPHFYTAMDVEMDALMALRSQFNSGREEAKISVNDFLLRAAALALAAHPEVNIHVSDSGITRFDQVDLCVAVAIDAGLVTPVIRNAARRSLTETAAEAGRLIAAARDRSLTAEDLRGGTFTLSNLGMYGVRHFDAIINPPQGAILAVGGPRREAREADDGGLRFASVATLTLSADHRGIDGAVAAQFLSTLKARIETPMSLVM